MRVAHRIDELHIDAHLIVRFLHAAFENVHHPELLRDVAQIRWRALESLGRRARNNLEVCHFRQSGKNFVLHAFSEIGVVGIATEIIERQDRD